VCTSALLRDTERFRTRVVTRIALGASKRIAPVPHRPHSEVIVRFWGLFELALHLRCPRWVDASPRASRRALARRLHRCPTRGRVRAPLGLAGARVTPDPSPVHCAGDAIRGRTSRHRYRGDRLGLRTGGRRRALFRIRRRPARAFDYAPGRHPLQLRTGALVAVGWRGCHARRSHRDARTRSLRRAVPALRSTHRRRIRFAHAVSGRHPALGPAADASARPPKYRFVSRPPECFGTLGTNRYFREFYGRATSRSSPVASSSITRVNSRRARNVSSWLTTSRPPR